MVSTFLVILGIIALILCKAQIASEKEFEERKKQYEKHLENLENSKYSKNLDDLVH